MHHALMEFWIAALRVIFAALLMFAAYSLVYDNLYRRDIRAGLKPDAITAIWQFLIALPAR